MLCLREVRDTKADTLIISVPSRIQYDLQNKAIQVQNSCTNNFNNNIKNGIPLVPHLYLKQFI